MGHINEILKQSDLIVEVLDARYPEKTRNYNIEKMAIERGKTLLLVLNKADLVDKTEMEEKKKALAEKTGFKVVFISAKDKDGINLVRRSMSEVLKKEGGSVGIIGYPNTGKSSLINALAGRGRGRVATSRKAGLTRGITKVKLSDGFYLFDSPGIIPFGEEEFDLFLVESKNPNQLKDVEGVALKLIELFESERFEKCFGLEKGSLTGKDADEILEAVARKRSWLSSGGKIDVARASREILEAYQRHEL